jgi:hypothetical protein
LKHGEKKKRKGRTEKLKRRENAKRLVKKDLDKRKESRGKKRSTKGA